jgi:hypothetical protein
LIFPTAIDIIHRILYTDINFKAVLVNYQR